MGKKSICIVNQYASTPHSGMGCRHHYISRSLVKKGYDVTIVSASFSHILNQEVKIKGFYRIKYVDGIRYIWLKTLKYKDVHSKLRVINWFIFAFALLNLPKYLTFSPNLFIYSSPSPIGSYSIKKLAARLNSKYVYEIRDIWPKTLIKLGGISSKNPIIKLMQWCEDYAYKHCNAACSNLENSIVHMENHGLSKNKFSWIPNGIDLEEVEKNKTLISPYKNIINREKFTIGYTGSIGLANSVNTLVDVAYKLTSYADIQIVIIGDGKNIDELKRNVKNNNLNNVLFLKRIKKKYIYSTLCLFDVCYIGWNNNSLYEFGIAANKIPEYMIAGKPIIHSYSGNCDPVSRAGSGITVPAESSIEIKNAILKLYNMDEIEMKNIGEKGQIFAKKYYDYSKISNKYINFLGKEHKEIV